MHSKKPPIKELQNIVTPYYAASWKEIGLQLGIPKGILQTIETNFQTDVEKCCAEMFMEWLDTDVTASWGKLIQIVYSPAVTKIVNSFNKSPLCNRKQLAESEAVEGLESKLKERHIVTRYKSSQEEDWLREPEHFTSVALIHQKSHKTRREIIKFANMHLKGDFTESGKITTDIAEIFNLMECTGHPYTLLIEGAPGIGKTILSKEIVFQWAKGNLLQKERLACLIYLRDPKIKTVNSFESFINYISYSQVLKGVEQYVCGNSGKGICLVFDGYDEYSEELRNSSFLSDVINRKVLELQLCNIIVTSRPSASACLHNTVDLRVEILGFTKEHRKSYIAHALKDNPKAIQDLLGYLESSYSVDAYCHIPLSMAILVFLFKEFDYDKNKLPSTQTDINYRFICITIRRFIKKSQQKSLCISKFSEVPTTYQEILLEISKLAFTALKDDKIVFTATEISDFCPSLLKESKHWNGLDLLKAVEYFNLEENADELSFNFLHFSVQELLAAYHISLMSETNQLKLLKETFWNSRYFNTWIMYVALTKNHPFAFKHFLSGNWLRISTKISIWWSGNAYIGISKNMKENKIKCLHLFQCFTEAGNDDMCHYVGNLLQDGIIDLSGQALSAVSLYTLSSFLAGCVRRQWSLLNLSYCYLDDENFERFHKSYASLTKSTVYINTIDLSSNVFTRVSASQIANVILNFNVKELVFALNEIKDIGIDQAIFTALLEHPNLVESRLIKIRDENQVILILYKKGFNESVALFIMFYCTKEAYEDVYLYIKNNSPFFETFLHTNNAAMFKTMLHRLVSKMIFFSVNFKFYVKNFNFTNEKISNTISSLASNVPLAVCTGESCLPLHLCNISNKINDENEMFDGLGTIFFYGSFSVRTIHSIFCYFLAKNDLNQIQLNGIVLFDYYIDYVSPKCMSLNSLQLFNCYVHGITRTNAVANVLSQVISKTQSLKHLNLSACRLKIEQMKIILNSLKQVAGINTISISDNNLAKGDSDALASIITCNRELQSIELSNCNLQGAAIVNIAKALENCKVLQSLDLSNNVITDEVAVHVAIVVESCQLVEDLRIQNCQLQYAGIQKIGEAMVKKRCLHCIDLSDNVISDQNAILIANVIVKNKNLKKVNFSTCKLQRTGCEQLFQAMAKITDLRHLNVSNNLLTDVAVDNFALMIHQNISLEYLNISGCCDKVKDFKKVTDSLVNLKSLNHLDLSCNVINLTSADNIAIIITNNAFLEVLNLSKCEYYKCTFLRITIALQNNRDLKYLYLNSNYDYDDDDDNEKAIEIARVINNNPFLENIDLSNYNLTEKELKRILSSLRNHTSLKRFDISSNTITNHVVNEIADVIDSNTQLTHLNISDSDIQEYGILEIFKAAQRINTLKSIKLCNCTITDQATQEISYAISINCMIEELVFTKDAFYETGISRLLNVLKEVHVLKYLTLASNNIISSINTNIDVTEVVSNNCITHFILSNCDLQKSSCSSIMNTLTLQAPNLQHIDLSDNNLSGTAETIAQLISVSYYLQYVNLANTSMQDEEVMITVKAMQNINSLRYVDLTSYSINDELTLELQSAIDKNPLVLSFKISKLFFKKNEVTVMTCGKNVFTIIINLKQVSICFSDNGNDEIDVAVILMKNNPDLLYLRLENCSSLEINLENVIVALTRNTKLEYFCLINIVITEKMVDEIAAVIENNIQMKHFELKGCRVTEKGLTKCIQYFNMTILSHLILSNTNNLIGHVTRKLKRPICNSLTHLNLSDVHLDIAKISHLSLPSLTKLQHLNLSHNPLTDESAGILSSVICNNHGLKHLDLCDCKLQSEGLKVVSDSLQAINIAYLNLSLNTINVDIYSNHLIPALLSNAKVIEYLYLPHCDLRRKEMNEMFDFISNAIHLKYIDVGLNEIAKSMINDFKNIMFVSKGYKQVSFSAKGIKQASLTSCETQSLYHSLHYLNVNNIIVNNEVGNMIADLIVNSPKLEHLEMAGVGWDACNTTKCFRALQNNNHLLHLNFSNKDYDFTFTKIFSLLTGCHALKILDLHSCFRFNMFLTITTTKVSLSNINFLDLSNNYINVNEVHNIANVIASNAELQHLNLHNCTVSSSGIHIINNALKLSSSLKFLDISFADNADIVSDNDEVATLLSNNKDLEHLRLSNLVLDNNKFHQIKCCIGVIKGLKRLIINDSIFTNNDTSHLASLIANNPALHELCLRDCKISVKGAISISSALYMQCLKLDTINITNPINKALNTNDPLHYGISRFTLTDQDVIAVMTVDNNFGELIMFKLILNQNSLKVLSTNNVTIRYLRVLHIKDCIFTDYYAHYVAFLITNNVATIQCFSLTACQLSIIQKTIITKALCKLNIVSLHYLNIEQNFYIDKGKNKIKKSSNFKTNCKLTDEIITAVMKDNFNLKISKLVINQNTLLQLRRYLKLIKGLVHLCINNCKFDIEDYMNVASVIANNDGIKEFIISNCSFPQNCLQIFKGLSFLRSLNLVTFEKINLTINTEDLIPIVIRNNSEINHFTISRCDVNESGLVNIMDSIAKELKKLLYLNCSHLKCSCEVVNHITTVLINNTKLKHINLCNCQLLTVDVKSIIQAAKNLTSLEYFDLCYNRMTCYLASDVTTLIANNENIKELSLPNYSVLTSNNDLIVVLNTVTDLLVNDIATLIATNKNIAALSLLDSTLNDDQLKVILNAVKVCSLLPYVDFTINEVNNKSIIEMGFKKMLKLLVIKNTIMHHSCDLVNFRGINHLGIFGCTFDFKEWSILKQLVAYNANLSTLILSDCQLCSEISEVVGICTHLSYLDLTNVNIVESSNLYSSPVWVSDNKPIIFKYQFDSLRTFSINCMDFTEQMTVDILNIVYSSKNLEYFAVVKCNVDECRDSSLWTPLFDCKNLSYLDLSYSNIRGEIAEVMLTNSKNISHIKMASCDFDTKGFLPICNALHKQRNIVHLNWNNNNCVCDYASEIVSIIKHNNNLMHIEMAACNFNKNGIVKICKSIGSCTKLQHINLSYNEIADQAIDAVVSMLSLCTCLEYINLQKCGLTYTGSKDVTMALESISTLKYVDLSLNEMAEDLAVHIGTVITNNTSFEILCLPDCKYASANSSIENKDLSCYSFSNYMVRCIFDSIKNVKSFRCVNFGSSQVNNDLASEVAALTASNRGLVQLKFSELILTHSGLKQLGSSILIIEGLNDISITGVHFTYADADNLATLIKNNKSLKSFDISDCVMSDKGKNVMFEAMINLTSLQSLILKNIVISGSVEDEVLGVIEKNTNLEYLEVTGCEMNTVKLNEVISSFNNLKVVF